MPIAIDPTLPTLPPDDQGFPNEDLGRRNTPALDEYLDALPYHGSRLVAVAGIPVTVRQVATSMRAKGQVPVATGSGVDGKSEVADNFSEYPESMPSPNLEGLLHYPTPSLLDQVIDALGLRHASREDIPRLAVLDKADLVKDRSMDDLYLYRGHLCLVELTRHHGLLLSRFDGAFERINVPQFRSDLIRLGDIGVTDVDFSHNSITGGRERITAHLEKSGWDLEYDVPFEPAPLLEWLVSVRNNAVGIVDLIRTLRNPNIVTAEEAERGAGLIEELFRESRWDMSDSHFSEIHLARVTLLDRPAEIRRGEEQAAISHHQHASGTSRGNPTVHQALASSFRHSRHVSHFDRRFRSDLVDGGMAFAGADVLAESDVMMMLE